MKRNDATQSVGLPWTVISSSQRPLPWQHTTLTTDRYPCPPWNSNPKFQQASGCRPMP